MPRSLRVFAMLALLAAPVTAQKNVESDPKVIDGLTQLRNATRPFQILDSAVAAGYPRDVRDCLVHEHHGAMGYHHVNRANVDRNAEIAKPEILLYERLADGTYRLNGVEYIVPYRFWPRDTIGPTIMGQKMKREDNLQFWYLHTWAWTPNKDGVFSDFHPAVRCSEGKVFKPFVDPTKP
jgi:hypothetical protein